jgi:predicted nucleic acid-binding protein
LTLILDTNALSAFSRGDLHVRQLIAQNPGPFLPVIVLGEYRFGLLSASNRSAQISWLEGLAREWTVLEISVATAGHYADLRVFLRGQGRPIPSNDTWIAALAREHNLPILTNDFHFDGIPGVDIARF